MKELYEKFCDMRNSPGIYIGKISVFILKSYIRGYLDREIELTGKYKEVIPVFKSFVKDYCKIYTDDDWDEILYKFCKNDERAACFETFKVIDKFYEKYYSEILRELKKVKVKLIEVPVKERHFTDHGNPKRFSNPHDHVIWYDTEGRMRFGPAINGGRQKV